MFKDSVMGGHGHCLYSGHWPLVDFAWAHWTVAFALLWHTGHMAVG